MAAYAVRSPEGFKWFRGFNQVESLINPSIQRQEKRTW